MQGLFHFLCPPSGILERPSDGATPKKLAFIQCVGSRDHHYNLYCSSVCCMHATKEAILANEHYPDLKSYIFYTDMRAVGKRFQEYITRAQEEYDVGYIRGRPSRRRGSRACRRRRSARH